jgi:hypothetical protein
MKTKLLILTWLLVAAGNLFAGACREEIGGKPFVRWMATIESHHSPREVAIMADDEVWHTLYVKHWSAEGAYRYIRKQYRELGKWVS